MPLSHIVHKANPLTLSGLRQDQARFPRDKWDGAECVHQLADVVAITFANRKSKRGEFFAERLELADVFGRSGDLQSVAVNNRDQVIEPIMRGGHASFPVRTFSQLAVPQQGKGAIVIAILLGSQGNADGEGQSVPQCTGVLFDAINLTRRMSNEVGAKLVERLELLLRKETAIGQDNEERFGAMSFALNIIVAIRILEVLWSYSQNPIVEHVQNINTGKVSPRMAGATLFDNAQDVPSVLHRFLFQFSFC